MYEVIYVRIKAVVYVHMGEIFAMDMYIIMQGGIRLPTFYYQHPYLYSTTFLQGIRPVQAIVRVL